MNSIAGPQQRKTQPTLNSTDSWPRKRQPVGGPTFLGTIVASTSSDVEVEHENAHDGSTDPRYCGPFIGL